MPNPRRQGSITKKTILSRGQPAGYLVCFERSGERQVGYWIGKEFWGKGLATRALTALLGIVAVRPLHARVAKHNLASLQVLTKCGFVICGEDKLPFNANGEQIEEFVLVLATGQPGRIRNSATDAA